MEMINKLPNNVKAYIEKNGSDLVDGYVRFLESSEIEEIAEILKKSSIWNDGIPFASTAFGDIIAWEEGYVILYKFTDENYTVMLSGTEFFFDNLADSSYRTDFFDMALYNAAIEKCGKIEKDECYVLEPIPKLGGAREIKYVNTGSLRNYLQFMILSY